MTKSTVTLEVEVDTEQLNQLVQVDWTEVEDGIARGTVSTDLEEVLLETVTGVMLRSSNAPAPIPQAIEYAVADPIWKKNLKDLSKKEDMETVPLDEAE